MNASLTENPHTLYDFQKEGVEFLLSELPATGMKHHVLGDEMGLGKTVQACAAIQELRNRNWNDPSALIFCPASAVVKVSWRQALIDWAGYSPEQIYIIKTGRDVIPTTAKAIIMGYELVTVPELKKQLFARWYTVVIADECQRLKNLKSKRTGVILGNRGNPLIARGLFKWLLSATWMPNRPAELYPAIKVLAPQVIAPHIGWDDFGGYYCDGYLEDFGGWNFSGASHVDEFSSRLTDSGFYMGRKVDTVFDELPSVVVENVYLDIGEMQEDISTVPMPTLRKAVGIKKLPYALEYIQDWLTDHPDEKLLVFTYTVDVIEALFERFKDKSVAIYGGVSAKYRDAAFESFTNGETQIYFMQVDAGGEGTNGLQFACNAALSVELQWSDGKEDQLIGRLRRIGQKKITKYTRLIAENTLDMPMHGTLKKKRKVTKALFGAKENEQMSIEQTLEQIRVLLSQNNELIQKTNELLGKPQSLTNTTVTTAETGTDVAAITGDTKEVEEKKPQGKPGRPAKNATPVDSTTVPAASETTVEPKTLEDVQNACRNYLKASGKTEAQARVDILDVFSTVGAKGVNDIPKDEYGKVVSAIEKLTPAVDPLFG